MALRLRAYWLDRPLTPEEVDLVSDALGAEVEQVKVPHVFPLADPHLGFLD